MPSYIHKNKILVRFRDQDNLGHVNNAVFATYLEEARVSFFDKVLADVVNWKQLNLILARLEIDFVQPIFLKDEITVETWCSKIGTKSFELTYQILRNESDIVANAKSVLVYFDYAIKGSSPLPDSWKQLLLKSLSSE